MCLLVGIGDRRIGNSDATRVGVLDDGHGRTLVIPRSAPSGIRVGVVVVAHLLAMELLGAGQAGAIGVQRRSLVRVLAVAQHVGTLVGGTDPLGELRDGLLAHPGSYSHVIRSRVTESIHSQVGALGAGEAPGIGSCHDVLVAIRVHHNGHRRVVLRGGAHHGRAADVDLLHAGIEVGSGGHGLGERVQVHNDQLEGLDTQVLQLLQVVFLTGVGQDSCVHARVQGLHAAFQHLRESGQRFNLGHGHSGFRDLLGGGTGGDDVHARGVQPLGQLLQAGLVVHADQCATDFLLVCAVGCCGAITHGFGSWPFVPRRFPVLENRAAPLPRVCAPPS